MAGAFGVVNHVAVPAEAHARQLRERLSLRVVRDLVIELAAHHEIDRRVPQQRFLRFDGDRRPDERHLQLRVRVLHHLRHLHVDVKSRRGSVTAPPARNRLAISTVCSMDTL